MNERCDVTECHYCHWTYPDAPPDLPAIIAHVRNCPLIPVEGRLGVAWEAFDAAERIGLEWKRQRDVLLAACQTALHWETQCVQPISAQEYVRRLRAAVAQAEEQS